MATSAEIFADEGKLGFMMALSSAAMRLRAVDTDPDDGVNTKEVARSGVNAPTVAYQTAAWAIATQHLTLLDADDMPSLKPVKTQSKNFPSKGLESDIFTNKNGAALVARGDDALFVAFRGSNDIDGGIGQSPDSSQWGDRRSDHWKLCKQLDAAIKIYLVENPEITKVYITGHSLGGGMVNAFMQSHKSGLYEGVSFGSIRYGEGRSRADDRVTNVWNDNDSRRRWLFTISATTGALFQSRSRFRGRTRQRRQQYLRRDCVRHQPRAPRARDRAARLIEANPRCVTRRAGFSAQPCGASP